MFKKILAFLLSVWQGLKPVARFLVNRVIDNLENAIVILLEAKRDGLSSEDIADNIIVQVVNAINRNIKNEFIRSWAVSYAKSFKVKLVLFLDEKINEMDIKKLAKDICTQIKKYINFGINK